MDQAIVIDDDDVVVIEDADRDELVLLERDPRKSPISLLMNTAKNQSSHSVRRVSRLKEPTYQSQSDSTTDASRLIHSNFVDLTTAIASSNYIPQDGVNSEYSASSFSSCHSKSMPRDKSYESPRPRNIAPGTGTNQESSRDPIDLSRCSLPNRSDSKENSETALNEIATISQSIHHTCMPKRGYSNASFISSSDEEDEVGTSLAQDVPSCADDNIVLIEDNDDFEFKLESQLLEKPEFEFLRSFSVAERSRPRPRPKVVRPLRNPPITSPYFECETYTHGKLNLRPTKTVELNDGDFVYIKHIVKRAERNRGVGLDNTANPSITIRGLRLQRCKYLNGMLEKKMNEVCLCYEIDLDDVREPEEQSLVEVPLSSIKTLRNLRWTNHSYPKYRNLDRDAAMNDNDSYNTGGLTVRWKYTCTYVSASAREKNVYAERTLERITEEWLSSVNRSSHSYVASNAELKTEWRGETTLGGSYVPEYYELDEEDDPPPEVEQPQISAMTKHTQSRPKTFIIVDEDNDDLSQTLRSQHLGSDGVQIKRKPEFSSSLDLDCDLENNQPVKRVRQRSEDKIEMIRQRLGRVRLFFDGENYVKHSYNIGTSSEPSSGSTTESNRSAVGKVHNTGSSNQMTSLANRIRAIQRARRNGLPAPRMFYRDHRRSFALSSASSPKIPPQIDITSSELGSPPPSGVISLPPSLHRSSTSSLAPLSDSRPPILKEPRTLSPGQTFTYGDAFCGGGGTTRGAVMAGLRVKWGFDFDHHACTTWRLNFPHATCYEMSSDRFVALATPSLDSSAIPDDVKVDILHLSPPCQYFSPAHTIEGKNDEMNTASLFAVAAVIKVARPRVVTLEQTFGILYPRFTGYFHSLICMFTSCGFSLRWDIVPLAQWGLPQRRFRLIIIASCPGEPLPPMPPPTHSSPLSPIPYTRPFKTVHQTLREIPPSAANHSPQLLPPKNLKPYNAHAILPRTMTTSGGENWHPSGTRGFTDREFACLQGFPLEHRFGQNGIKRQIGNAVPPVVAKVLFEGIRRFMEGTDGIVRGDGGEDGDGDEDGGMEHKMDVFGDMEGESRVELMDMVDETDPKDSDGEEDLMELLNGESDDEVEIVRTAKVKRQYVID